MAETEEKPPELTLTDDQITALIDDPATILTHEIALYVIDTLDAEIAQIQSQIDATQIRYNNATIPAETDAWLRRAAYARAMRRNARHRVMQRDKEIRGTKFQTAPNVEKKQANLLRQERLKTDAEMRRKEKRKEVRYARAFVKAARAHLAADEFKRISQLADMA